MRQKELAKELGLSHQVVSKMLRRAGWRWGKGPWGSVDLEEIREWRKGFQENRNTEGIVGGGTTAELQAAKLLLMKERGQKLRTEREILQQKRVLREEMETERAAQYQVVKRGLMGIPRSLRQILADTSDPAEVERILTEALRSLCNEGFSGNQGAAWYEPV